ncbi:hypothetical protein [Stigmatella hybrida]|uniref:hypothetical protein n=1 Tax=Stigmatella hybrida TaxID=394097 RepID=UPI001CDB1DA3|nr:hypothetical protein [Stigmatella hybrida]
MPQGPSPLARVGLLFFSVSVVGALIGFGWEARLSEQEEARIDNLLSEDTQGVREPPARQSGPSAEEKAIVQRATQGLPPYKDAVPQPLAADFLDANSPFAVAWFITRDTPWAVLDFYQDALLKEGLPPVQHRYNANAGYVGYVMPRTQKVHMVSVLAQGGETMVFVSAGQVESFIENQGQLPPGLPLPPGAREPVTLTFREEGRVRYSVMASLAPEQVNGVQAFYQQALEPQGWLLEDGAREPSPEPQFSFRRGDSRLNATVQREGAGARLYLSLEQQK